MRASSKFLIGLIIVVIIIALLSLFTVQQYQQAFILRLGKIETNAKGQPNILQPGLHFRVPFVESVEKFDMRLRTLNIDSSRIMTSEQKEVLVDAFVKWKIGNVVQYYKATGGNTLRSDTLLMQQTNDGMREEFGMRNITQLLSNERSEVMQNILQKVKAAAQQIGVDVIDVRIKRIDLPTEVAEPVYSRMRKAREKNAALIRAQGQEQAQIIRAKANATVTVTLATARSDAAKIMATGDAEASQIYLESYNKDPRFYTFFRSLEAYQAVFDHQHATLVLQPQGRFFDFFNSLSGLNLQR